MTSPRRLHDNQGKKNLPRSPSAAADEGGKHPVSDRSWHPPKAKGGQRTSESAEPESMVKEVLGRARNHAVLTGGDSLVAQVSDSVWESVGFRSGPTVCVQSWSTDTHAHCGKGAGIGTAQNRMARSDSDCKRHVATSRHQRPAPRQPDGMRVVLALLSALSHRKSPQLQLWLNSRPLPLPESTCGQTFSAV